MNAFKLLRVEKSNVEELHWVRTSDTGTWEQKIGKDKYFSCTSMADQIEYSKDHIAVPHYNCGPLSAFNSLNDVRTFLRTFGFWLNGGWTLRKGYEIWIVKAWAYKYHVRGLWKGPGLTKTDLPEGTILCAAIRLLRKMEFSKPFWGKSNQK